MCLPHALVLPCRAWNLALNPACLALAWHFGFCQSPTLDLIIGVLSTWTHRVMTNLFFSVFAVRIPTANPYLPDHTTKTGTVKSAWFTAPLDVVFRTADCPSQGPVPQFDQATQSGSHFFPLSPKSVSLRLQNDLRLSWLLQDALRERIISNAAPLSAMLRVTLQFRHFHLSFRTMMIQAGCYSRTMMAIFQKPPKVLRLSLSFSLFSNCFKLLHD